jgi:hypothetical protein
LPSLASDYGPLWSIGYRSGASPEIPRFDLERVDVQVRDVDVSGLHRQSLGLPAVRPMATMRGFVSAPRHDREGRIKAGNLLQVTSSGRAPKPGLVGVCDGARRRAPFTSARAPTSLRDFHFDRAKQGFMISIQRIVMPYLRNLLFRFRL